MTRWRRGLGAEYLTASWHMLKAPEMEKFEFKTPAFSPLRDSQFVAWLKDLEKIPGWLSPSSGFISVALAQFQMAQGWRGNIAEIGVYHGKYLVGLSTALRADEYAIAVDIFENQFENSDLAGYDEVGPSAIRSLTEEAFRRNFETYCPGRRLHVISRSSLEVNVADLVLDSRKIRFFSIDGGHSLGVFLNDLKLAEASLSDQGIISIDDILNAQWPGIVTGAVRFFDGPTRLRPIAFIANKLLCSFEPFADVYREVLRQIAPRSLQRRNVEFSNFYADQYFEGEDLALFLEEKS